MRSFLTMASILPMLLQKQPHQETSTVSTRVFRFWCQPANSSSSPLRHQEVNTRARLPPFIRLKTSTSQDDWYDSNYFCSQYVDETAVFLEIGGCKYDYPMGQCMDIDVDVLDGARGCAFELEMHMTDKVRRDKSSMLAHHGEVEIFGMGGHIRYAPPAARSFGSVSKPRDGG